MTKISGIYFSPLSAGGLTKLKAPALAKPDSHPCVQGADFSDALAKLDSAFSPLSAGG
jgi:hypothetical protein